MNSYNAVGITGARIFVINPSGTVSTSNITSKRTYDHLSTLCAEMFPSKEDFTVPESYSALHYWKDPSLEWFDDLGNEKK